MVVGDRAGERPAAQRLPKVVALVVLDEPAADHAALRAEEGLVGGAAHQVGAFGERLLEVRPEKAEHVGCVVEDDGVDALLGEETPDLGDRLAMQHHAASEDDQLGPLAGDQLPGRGQVDEVGVVVAHGEVHDRRRVGARVVRHEVAQRAHRLGAQVTALADVVVHHHADAPRLSLGVGAVDVVEKRAEHRHVGHLTADQAGLGLGAAQILAELRFEATLNRGDEAGALVVEDLVVVEGLGPAVFGVAKRRVRDRSQAHER